MAICKSCGGQMEWGFDTNTRRWITLEPVETHEDLDLSFVDENGVLRADHRDRHGSKSVNVSRLEKKVPSIKKQRSKKKAS